MSDNIIVPKQQIDELIEDIVKTVEATGGSGDITDVKPNVYRIKGGDHDRIMEELGRKYRLENEVGKRHVHSITGIQFGDGWWGRLTYNSSVNWHTLFVPDRFSASKNMNHLPMPYLCEDEIVEQLCKCEPDDGYDEIGVNVIIPKVRYAGNLLIYTKSLMEVQFFNGGMSEGQSLFFWSPSFYDEDNRRDMVDIVKAYAESRDIGFVESNDKNWIF